MSDNITSLADAMTGWRISEQDSAGPPQAAAGTGSLIDYAALRQKYGLPARKDGFTPLYMFSYNFLRPVRGDGTSVYAFLAKKMLQKQEEADEIEQQEEQEENVALQKIAEDVDEQTLKDLAPVLDEIEQVATQELQGGVDEEEEAMELPKDKTAIELYWKGEEIRKLSSKAIDAVDGLSKNQKGNIEACLQAIHTSTHRTPAQSQQEEYKKLVLNFIDNMTDIAALNDATFRGLVTRGESYSGLVRVSSNWTTEEAFQAINEVNPATHAANMQASKQSCDYTLPTYCQDKSITTTVNRLRGLNGSNLVEYIDHFPVYAPAKTTGKDPLNLGEGSLDAYLDFTEEKLLHSLTSGPSIEFLSSGDAFSKLEALAKRKSSKVHCRIITLRMPLIKPANYKTVIKLFLYTLPSDSRALKNVSLIIRDTAPVWQRHATMGVIPRVQSSAALAFFMAWIPDDTFPTAFDRTVARKSLDYTVFFYKGAWIFGGSKKGKNPAKKAGKKAAPKKSSKGEDIGGTKQVVKKVAQKKRIKGEDIGGTKQVAKKVATKKSIKGEAIQRSSKSAERAIRFLRYLQQLGLMERQGNVDLSKEHASIARLVQHVDTSSLPAGTVFVPDTGLQRVLALFKARATATLEARRALVDNREVLRQYARQHENGDDLSLSALEQHDPVLGAVCRAYHSSRAFKNLQALDPTIPEVTILLETADREESRSCMKEDVEKFFDTWKDSGTSQSAESVAAAKRTIRFHSRTSPYQTVMPIENSAVVELAAEYVERVDPLAGLDAAGIAKYREGKREAEARRQAKLAGDAAEMAKYRKRRRESKARSQAKPGVRAKTNAAHKARRDKPETKARAKRTLAARTALRVLCLNCLKTHSASGEYEHTGGAGRKEKTNYKWANCDAPELNRGVWSIGNDFETSYRTTERAVSLNKAGQLDKDVALAQLEAFFAGTERNRRGMAWFLGTRKPNRPAVARAPFVTEPALRELQPVVVSLENLDERWEAMEQTLNEHFGDAEWEDVQEGTEEQTA